MLTTYQEDDYIEYKFSSEIKMVNKIIKEVRSYLESYDVDEYANIILILRELINNAIEHGNKQKKDRIVSVNISLLDDKRFKIVVSDEGDGFDYNNINYRMSDDPTQIRNRGLCLVNSFADEMEFNSYGNMITVYVTASESTQFHVEEIKDWTVIHPSGDITAEDADNFRYVMHDCLDKGKTKFRFDLSQVNDVDSIGLSLFVIFSNLAKKKSPNIGLEMINANQDINNLFQITRLNRIYKIIES